MSQFLSLVLAGAISGGLYALMASGLVLTYQASGVFNLGHGSIAFVTALVYFQLNQPTAAGGLGLPILPAAVISILLVAPALGVMLDAMLFRRLAQAPIAARLVGTVGMLIALPAAAFLIIGAINGIFGTEMPDVSGDAGVSPPGIGPTPARSWSIAKGISVNSDQLAIVVVAALAAAGLWYLLRHTRLGLETRAGVDRPVLARLRGIDTDRSSRIVWALSTLLAGCAGVLIAPLFDLSALTFHMIVFTSFTAAVAAKLRSVPLAFAAGIALGVIQNLVYGYSPGFLTAISGFRTSVPFILLFVLLFFVQGRGGRTAGSVAEDAPVIEVDETVNEWRRRAPWAISGLLLIAYVMLMADGYWTGVVNRGLVLAVVFLSFVVVTGIGGMINLAQATFVTVGGFTAGWLVNHQWPSTVPGIMDNGRFTFWIALIASVVVAALVGVLVALPSLRLGGLTLALATLALAFIGDRLVFQLEGVRNGSRGWSIPRPSLGPIDLANDKTLFLVLFVVVLVCVWIVNNLAGSATGRSLLALRSSPVAAATSGIDPLRSKLVLFAVSAGLAGFAGAWFALVNSPMTNHSAPPLLGLIWLAVAVTFGIRRPGGAVVAGLVYAIQPVVLLGIGANWDRPWSLIPDQLRELIARPELSAALFGLGAIALAREPDGILAEVANRRRARRSGSSAITESEGVVGSKQPVADTSTEIKSAHVEDALLSLRSINAGYGEVQVLHDLDLDISRGEVIAILGANGAGKSTLCGVIAGTVRPSSGTVVFSSADVTAMRVHERARSGVILAPEARGIFPGLSVDDNLSIRLSERSEKSAAKARFPILGERSDQHADLLSGGEQQQLAMAVVLANPPELFIADEPSLGLSPMATITVFDALAELKELGTTMILVEEKAGSALAVADRAVIMDLGRIVWVGAADEVDLEMLGQAYLGA